MWLREDRQVRKLTVGGRIRTRDHSRANPTTLSAWPQPVHLGMCWWGSRLGYPKWSPTCWAVLLEESWLHADVDDSVFHVYGYISRRNRPLDTKNKGGCVMTFTVADGANFSVHNSVLTVPRLTVPESVASHFGTLFLLIYTVILIFRRTISENNLTTHTDHSFVFWPMTLTDVNTHFLSSLDFLSLV